MVSTFLPSGRALGRLVKRQGRSSSATVEVERGHQSLLLSFTNHATEWRRAKVQESGAAAWTQAPLESVFIPVNRITSYNVCYTKLLRCCS